MNDMDALDALDSGLDVADTRPEVSKQESAEQKAIQKKVMAAREYDKQALIQYAHDRRVARGDSGFHTDGNIVGTNIDILRAFLYARDPDVTILPSRGTEPPKYERVKDVMEDAGIWGSEAVLQAGMMAEDLARVAPQLTGEPVDAAQAAEQAREMVVAAAIDKEHANLVKEHAKEQRQRKALAETLELIVSRMWRDGGLKKAALPCVGSALTIGIGWVKGSWQERTGDDPATRKAINDLQDNLRRSVAKRSVMDEAQGDELDTATAEYQRQIDALNGSVERVIARGFVIDQVPAEDVTVATGVTMECYTDAPWIDHRVPMRHDEALAQHNMDVETLKKATLYGPRKPERVRTTSPMVADDFDEEHATGWAKSSEGDDKWVMKHETWDRESNVYFTWIEGVDGFVDPPVEPTATTRFFPFFCYVLGSVDGERHPQSLVSRSHKLVDEYYRIGDRERDHRSRLIPKTLANAGAIDATQLDKINRAKTGEYVAVEMVNPSMPLQNVLYVPQYPPLDPAAYDRSRLMQEIERLFGVQEALSGAVTVAKTAREAEIQQSGMQARTGAMRDALEVMLSDLARYTAEVARAHITPEDVAQMVGQNAHWPPYQGAEELGSMVHIEVSGGTTGRPNTTAQREAWSVTLPLLQQGIQQVAALRNSDPADVADAIEEIMRITAERSGDRIDIDSLMPQAGPAPQPGGPPMPGGPPGMPGGPMPAPDGPPGPPPSNLPELEPLT